LVEVLPVGVVLSTALFQAPAVAVCPPATVANH
jgi:hypothetical protein